MSPIFLLTLLLFSVSLTFAQKQCPKCGPMEVPYPLSTSPNCGLPNYKLSCNNNHHLHFLSVNNFAYRVLSITPETSRLIIQPPKLQINTCRSTDLPFKGFKIDANSPFNISKINTVMLFNCSASILESPLDCSLTSPCRRLLQQKGAPGCGNICCTYLKDASMTSRQIRVRPGGCTAYTSVVDFKPHQSVSEWNFGIGLQWLPPN